MAHSLPRSGTQKLLTGPAGSGKTHRALAAIRTATTQPGKRGRGATGPGEALLILPTYAQVLHTKRLALSRWDARGILDEPFTTFTAAGERFLDHFRVRALPTADERDRFMEEALRQAAVALFERVADRVGFRSLCLRLVKEVKQTGLEHGEALRRLEAGASALEDAARERLEGFAQVFRAYDGLLGEAELEDHEDTLRRLLLRLESGPLSRVPRLLVVDAFDDFTPIEERILLALARAVSERDGDVLVTLPFDPEREALFDSSAGVRERLLGFGFSEERLVDVPRASTPALAALAERLFAPPAKPLVDLAGVEVLVAGDADDEADRVARAVRRAVEAGREDGSLRGWRDVGIVVRRVDDIVPRFESAFRRLGIPLRVVGAGKALASEPVVRALRGPLAVLAGRIDAGRFEPRDVSIWLRWRAAALRDADLARAVDELEIEQRAKGFPPDYEAYRAAAGAPLAAALDELDAAREALAASHGARAVYGGLRETLASLAPLGASSGLDSDGRPRDEWHDRRLAWATLARDRVLDVFTALESAAARTGSGDDVGVELAVDEVFDAIERSRIALPDRRLDAVSLLDAEEARYWELPMVVVAGLEEGRFPVHPREDVLLRDDDRETLGAADDPLRLPLSRDRESRERRLFYVALTRASKRLVLSRAAYDPKGDPRSPSFFLRDVERVLALPDVRAPRPGRVAPTLEQCYTRRDLRLFASARVRDLGAPEAERRLARALLDLSHARVLERAARDRRPEADPIPECDRGPFRTSVERVSASRLNNGVQCLHRFFLGVVVRLDQDDVPFEGPVFDYRREGTLLHRLLELALTDPNAEPDDVAREVLSDQDLDPVSRHLFQDEFVRVVQLFRDRELRTAGDLEADTGSLELKFGYRRDLVLGEGEGAFAFRGTADRVDRDGPRIVVVDYKSSVGATDKAVKEAKVQEDLQLPLYALALEALATDAGKPVTAVGVEWIAIRNRARRIVADTDQSALFLPRQEGKKVDLREHAEFRCFLDDALEKAQEIVAAVRDGVHEKRPLRARICETCPYASVCRPADPGGAS